jgi:hypothetical protein
MAALFAWRKNHPDDQSGAPVGFTKRRHLGGRMVVRPDPPNGAKAAESVPALPLPCPSRR